MMDEKLGYVHFWLTFLGVYLVFMPMHYVGIAGFPRRYYSCTGFDAFSKFADLNMFIICRCYFSVYRPVYIPV